MKRFRPSIVKLFFLKAMFQKVVKLHLCFCVSQFNCVEGSTVQSCHVFFCATTVVCKRSVDFNDDCVHQVVIGRSPLCLNIQSSSVSFDRCCHSLLIHVFVAWLKSRLICIVLSVTSRFVNLLPDRSGWRHQRLEVRKSSNHRVDTLAHIYTCSSLAVAQPHEHSEHRLLQRPTKIHSGSGAVLVHRH